MSLIAVVGDGCTTTALGLAASWPVGEPCLLAELDPAGGCLAAWLDVPRSPGLAEVVASSTPGSWATVRAMAQRSRSGVEVLVAPTRSVEAAAVVLAATASVLPVFAGLDLPVVIADGGRLRGPMSGLVLHAGIVVITHRQHAGSAAAAALGLERVAELAAQLSARSIPSIVALIGDRPYGVDEVAQFVRADCMVVLADDPWAAAVLAGRAGSATRLRRSPLMRSLAELAGIASAMPRGVGTADVWAQSFDASPIGDRS